MLHYREYSLPEAQTYRRNYVYHYVLCVAFPGRQRQRRAAVAGGEPLDQLVSHREAGGSHARVDPQLIVNGGEMGGDRAQANDELLRHLGIGESLGHQPQDFSLTGGQSCWRGGMTCGSSRGGTRR